MDSADVFTKLAQCILKSMLESIWMPDSEGVKFGISTTVSIALRPINHNPKVGFGVTRMRASDN